MSQLNPAAALPRWVDEALCVGDSRSFFGSHVGAAEDAMLLCAACPVSGLCLEFGLAEPAGIYGGLGPKARKRLRRDLRRREKAASL